jgi:imidazole glycerol-phosphate synthase subunit HisF
MAVRSRLIPVLLLDRNRRLVKTIGFGPRTYIGDPFNVVRLFNEKEVDEIVILDIDATIEGRETDVGFVAELASECFMPLSFGGGLVSMNVCEALARRGVEKFVLGASVQNQALVKEMAASFGEQAVVGCVDYRGGLAGQAYVGGGKTRTSKPLLDYVREVEDSRVGEILLQSIDHDGQRMGMDIPTIKQISSSVGVPVVALGGAGTVEHLVEGLTAGASAAASGSAFSFIGRLRAVLITYPDGESL